MKMIACFILHVILIASFNLRKIMKLLLLLLSFSFYSIASTKVDQNASKCLLIDTINEFEKPYKFIGFSKLKYWCQNNSKESINIYALSLIPSLTTNKETNHV